MGSDTYLLNEVKSHFDNWRLNRTKRGKIPSELWDKVTPLIGQYPVSKIAASLGINTNQLKENIHIKTPLTFVEVSTDIKPSLSTERPSSSIDNTQTCKIELHHINGTMLKISELPIPSLSAIITQFIG